MQRMFIFAPFFFFNTELRDPFYLAQQEFFFFFFAIPDSSEVLCQGSNQCHRDDNRQSLKHQDTGKYYKEVLFELKTCVIFPQIKWDIPSPSQEDSQLQDAL